MGGSQSGRGHGRYMRGAAEGKRAEGALSEEMEAGVRARGLLLHSKTTTEGEG